MTGGKSTCNPTSRTFKVSDSFVVKRREKDGKFMEKNYLVQMILDDGDFCVSLMNEYELIHFVDTLDYNDYVTDYHIYDVSVFGKIKQIHYKGWQPNCLIEFVDDDGNVVVSGYGEDH